MINWRKNLIVQRTSNMRVSKSIKVEFCLRLICVCILKYAECSSEDSADTFTDDAYKSRVDASEPCDSENCTINELDNKSWRECGDRGYIMNCGGLNLCKVPRIYPVLNGTTPHLTPPLCLLNLSHNHFHTLRNNSFVAAGNMNSTDVMWLYLYSCHIKYIESNAFMHLSNLIYLNLSGNHLTWPEGFDVGVFRPLVSLKNINLYGNNFTTFNGLGHEMQYMKNLKGLFINLCENCKFDKGFANLTRLTNLSLSQITVQHSCFVPYIYNDTFKYLSKVKNLFIGSCHIRNIEAGAFSSLQELVILDMSYNEGLHFEGMNTALYGLRYSTTLKILNVNRIHEMEGLGVMVKGTDMENIKTLKALEILHMDLNKVELFEEDVPHDSFPQTIRHLTLTGNRLTYGKYMRHLLDVKGVVRLDVSRQHLDYDPFFFEHSGRKGDIQHVHAVDSSVDSSHQLEECNCKVALCLPENIETFEWSKSFVWLRIHSDPKPLVFCGAKHLKRIDLSFNLITTLNFIIFGLENVTDLDLSWNTCDEISTVFFFGFKSLLKLNLSHNKLGDAFSKIEPSQQPNLFRSLTKLEEIDLTSGKISHLHEDMFKNLSNIKRAYLGYNLLSIWNTSLENSRCLEILNLTNNKLNVLDEATTTYLDSLTTEPCYTEVIIDLSANPLDCVCNHLNFLKWARYTKITIKLTEESNCHIEGKLYPLRNHYDLDNIINILESDTCKREDRAWVTWVASVLSVVCTGFLSAVSCFLVHKHRWKLRHLYYTRHRRHVLEGYDRLFQYDVYISYAKTLGSFMKHSAVPMLEEIHHLKTWAYDKDSVPGVSVAENITHAISNSMKVVLLLNRDYLKDSWCEYETHMACVESIVTNRKMVILVMLEQIKMEELPLYLRRLLMTERSVEYPQHGQDESTFWMNLAEEIGA